MFRQATSSINSDELSFHSTVADAKEHLGAVDLVFTSGALHCTSDPLGNLTELLNVDAQKLFITRTIFSEGNEQVAIVQHSRLSTNGPGPLTPGVVDQDIFYPNSFVPFEHIERTSNKYGYSTRFKMREDSSVFDIEGLTLNMYGLFCEKQGVSL